MDYDRTKIPEAYDRSRDHGPEVLALWMNAIEARVDKDTVRRILDLGCGTGRFSQALAAHFDAEVIGVDPSSKMLARAREKQHDPRVRYVEGSGERIPLDASSIDLVFMSMSFHHFGNPRDAARECRRVLRDGGSVVVRTGTREQIPNYPYVPFFPATPEMIADLLPDLRELRDVFESAGLRPISAEIITQTIAPNWMVYADKVAAGGDSIISRLSEQQLEAGLAELRHYAATASEPVVEPIDLLVFRQDAFSDRSANAERDEASTTARRRSGR
jgi:ubiquinone/menaquinone biosynthesis C-methylase UbiE